MRTSNGSSRPFLLELALSLISRVAGRFEHDFERAAFARDKSGPLLRAEPPMRGKVREGFFGQERSSAAKALTVLVKLRRLWTESLKETDEEAPVESSPTWGERVTLFPLCIAGCAGGVKERKGADSPWVEEVREVDEGQWWKGGGRNRGRRRNGGREDAYPIGVLEKVGERERGK